MLACATAFASSFVSFNELVDRPEAFANKRVSVVGVAEVDSTSFVLFQPPSRTLSDRIFVAQKLDEPRYNHLNNHWVRVTGLVNPNRRGKWDFACTIELDRVEPLNRPPVHEVKTFGVFLNDSPHVIMVELFNKAAQLDTKMTLSPGEMQKTAVEHLRTVVVYTSSGSQLSRLALDSDNPPKDSFDEAARTLYFRVFNTKIELVPLRLAKPLKDRWAAFEKQE